jgi:hypothetical protein
MRISLLSLTCGFALLASASAMAGGDPSSARAMTNQTKVQPAAQRICRAPVHQGLLVRRAKQCYTADQWHARRLRMQNSIRDYQDRSLTRNNGI